LKHYLVSDAQLNGCLRLGPEIHLLRAAIRGDSEAIDVLNRTYSDAH